jgi:hypothetical protein
MASVRRGTVIFISAPSNLRTYTWQRGHVRATSLREKEKEGKSCAGTSRREMERNVLRLYLPQISVFSEMNFALDMDSVGVLPAVGNDVEGSTALGGEGDGVEAARRTTN